MQNESAPEEFTPEFIAQHSPESAQLYRDFLRCGEPWLSLFANNPHLQPPRYNEPLSDDPSCYWNTTVARKHPYWQNFELPQPTQHIQTMRADLSAGATV